MTDGYDYKYEYDTHGNKIKATILDKNGTIKFVYKYEYDEHGKEMKIVSYDIDDINTQ